MTVESDLSHGAQIERFVAESRKLTGSVVPESSGWNRLVTPQSIRHVAYGISDDNPLYLDAEYAARSVHGGLIAPPAFLASVLYPALHGAPVVNPMMNFITRIAFRWERTLVLGDELSGQTRQTHVSELDGSGGRRLVTISSEADYHDAPGRPVGSASASVLNVEKMGDEELLLDRPTHRASDDEIAQLIEELRAEWRRGERPLDPSEVKVGDELPSIVRGPFQIGDLVAWQAAIGPSYRAGRLGYLDALDKPHATMTNPVTGWRIKRGQQHEDPNLSRARGMPGPFDNGVMRLAWLSPLITNWMGDHARLASLDARILAPNIYGDITRYTAHVTDVSSQGAAPSIAIKITGTNQNDEVTTTSTAEVVLHESPKPLRRVSVVPTTHTVATPDPVERQLAGAFERHADADAVVGGDRRWTYRELDAASDAIVRRLRDENVNPGDAVGVLAGRSAAAIAAMVGVLKSGAAFVPLDVSYPAARLVAMADAADASVILGDDSGIGGAMTDGSPRSYIEIESAWEHETGMELTDVAPDPDTPAYYMFTSGSTDRPKAVPVSREALSWYIPSLQPVLGVEPNDVYLHTASFSFSASIRQLLVPLTTGATLVVADDAQRRDVRELEALVRRERATIWDTVPTVWRTFVNVCDPSEPLPLRLILSTGEPLPWQVVRDSHAKLGPDVAMINLYSQTETAGTVAALRIDPDFMGDDGIVPLGRPIDNVELYLLDDRMNPVPKGEPGQIYIGGPRLAQRYVGDPAQTASRFVADPFSDRPGARLYATGDRGRFREDGVIEPMGRLDDRLKVRGFRVEPSEIESTLARHASVCEAAVIVHRQTLAAFVVADGGAPTPAHLEAHLADSLAEYMVPRRWHFVDELPRLPSGKRDRRRLAAQLIEGDDTIAATVAPVASAPTEETLVGIWARLLGRGDVPTDQTFAQLGGDSLLAIELLVEIERAFDRRLSLDRFLVDPTITGLARAIETPEEDSVSGMVLLNGPADHPPVFCLPGGGGHPTTFTTLAAQVAGEIPIYGIQYSGLTRASEARASVEEFARDVLADIRRVQPTGPLLLLGYSFGGQVAYEVTQQLRARGESVAWLGLLDTFAPGAVTRRPAAQRLRLHAERVIYGPNRADYVAGRIRRVSNRLTRRSNDTTLLKMRRLARQNQDSDLPDRLVRYRRAKTRAERRYRPVPYVGDMTLFKAESSESHAFVEIAPKLGWAALVNGRLDVIPLPGKHLELFDESNVSVLADRLRECLSRALIAATPGE